MGIDAISNRSRLTNFKYQFFAKPYRYQQPGTDTKLSSLKGFFVGNDPLIVAFRCCKG